MIFIYLVENKNKIIGTYLDYSIAETFVLTLLQNNIINDIITINRYILNSGYSQVINSFCFANFSSL